MQNYLKNDKCNRRVLDKGVSKSYASSGFVQKSLSSFLFFKDEQTSRQLRVWFCSYFRRNALIRDLEAYLADQ